jgi:hypothetical protein
MRRLRHSLGLPRDVARILGCSAEKVCLLADRDELPLLGRTLRGVRVFRLSDVQRYATERVGEREAVPGRPGEP